MGAGAGWGLTSKTHFTRDAQCPLATFNVLFLFLLSVGHCHLKLLRVLFFPDDLLSVPFVWPHTQALIPHSVVSFPRDLRSHQSGFPGVNWLPSFVKVNSTHKMKYSLGFFGFIIIKLELTDLA